MTVRENRLAFSSTFDAELQVLEWALAGDGTRFGMVPHHDDAELEFAYDDQSPAGRADQILDETSKRGLTLVSMQRDWKRIYPFER